MVARQDTPPLVQHSESVFDSNTVPSSSSNDKSEPCFSVKNQSLKVNSRRRGRPRNQTPVVSTDYMTIEPKRKLRKREPARVQVNMDVWDKLSQAPSVTPVSPKKVPQSGPSKKPVIYLSCHDYPMF